MRPIVALCGATLTLLLAPETATQAAPRDGRIAAVLENPGHVFAHCPGPEPFPGECGYQDTIETFKRDGAQRRRVARRTTKAGDDRLHDVAWSPTGRLIAFMRRSAPGLMRPDGSHRHLLRNGRFFGFYNSVAWAPDRRHLFLGGARNQSAADGMYRVRTDGSYLHRLTHGSDSDPAVSRTGELAFVRLTGGTSWVYVLPRPGARAKRLLPGEAPAWSPDGKRLAFARDNGLWLCSSSGALAATSPAGARPAITTVHPHGRLAAPGSRSCGTPTSISCDPTERACAAFR